MLPNILRRAGLATGAARVLGSAAFAIAAPAAVLADDLFSVAGVTVDVEAESARAARLTAVDEAVRRALGAMLRKIVPAADRARLPVLDGEAAALLARGYEVTRERRSARRYIGEFTVRFDDRGIRRLLGDAGIRHAETRSPPVLALPVLAPAGEPPNLWGAENPWRDAWRALDRRNRLVRLLLPGDDPENRFVAAAAEALAGDSERLDAIARRHGAAAVLVAIARPGPAGGFLSVEIRPHGAPVVAALRFAEPGGEGSHRRAAAAAAAAIEERWIADNLLDRGSRASLDATARLSGFASWLSLRRRLAALTQIDRVEVRALGIAGAALTLHYFGAEDSLRAALARRGVALAADGADGWRFVVGPEARAEPAADAPPLDDLAFE